MDCTRAFLERTKDDAEFEESLHILQVNSRGNIWMMGGFVYRTICAELYGITMPRVDIDAIVEELRPPITLPLGWVKRTNSYGNPKLVNGGREIDIVPLHSLRSVNDRGLEPSIDNFLLCTPLTVQSVVFEVFSSRVLGDIGKDAIRSRTVAVNYAAGAEYAARKKGMSLQEMLEQKAGQLGFRVQ